MNKLWISYEENLSLDAPDEIFEIGNYSNPTKYTFAIEHPYNRNYSIWINEATNEPVRVYNPTIKEFYFFSKIECLKKMAELTERKFQRIFKNIKQIEQNEKEN